MNKYEKRAKAERKAAIRSAMTLWSAGIAVLVLVALLNWIGPSLPSSNFSKIALGAAVILLVVRLVSRRSRSDAPRAAQPDPKSSIKLN